MVRKKGQGLRGHALPGVVVKRLRAAAHQQGLDGIVEKAHRQAQQHQEREKHRILRVPHAKEQAEHKARHHQHKPGGPQEQLLARRCGRIARGDLIIGIILFGR